MVIVHPNSHIQTNIKPRPRRSKRFVSAQTRKKKENMYVKNAMKMKKVMLKHTQLFTIWLMLINSQQTSSSCENKYDKSRENFSHFSLFNECVDIICAYMNISAFN